ncbi:UDP-N-acetylglucosamine 2-epimerase (non-hydrolyzing) [Chryseobacterium sp. Ch-15]|uniref:UDP-N-acetylglucosamine 2-epimerase (Non-hydrolyzing) n=1 Tax=Chryseobacterium muglaense TaxID=2893752 RepID=A0A9Q3V0T5_9FLAO|nr:UDP-N-acetylglucosamine 2-epimerase (non-hydrolyzing) [Chryseobacterium muglaense]MBD3905457.1 UDP-N-acetylglucosamine 2-epimerase (non-hydrolyzing) [Chryseobacterium muglaense]MCC9036470.1 UDP-N-acetylglucosamine 2-epimerase (non-hydrolyzing) [Chryseobacterium muglaense]MCM2555395.1 UDP-N-acetylglucosamine 2-epimerase (non-hydrolyzing) [Chryseobacterium muglaense]
MEKLKVVTILGTRPEIIRLTECIKKCDQYFEHILIHTGQNYDYELNEIFFEDLELRKPDYFLNVAGEHLGETIGNVISKSYEILLKEKPDALLVLGDTNSVLSTIAAKRLKIPIFHMEAGNRCFDQNVPEEINRKISDHISDINLTYTENSRRYLLSEGFRKDHVFVTGSPLKEVLDKYQNKIEQSDVVGRLSLKENDFIVVSAHREENIDLDNHFEILVDSINAVAEKYQMPIIFSTHPRTKNRIEKNNIKFHSLIQNVAPLGFFDYVKLQSKSFIVLSDSGTISEESAMMGFPAVSIRTSTERPEAIDAGTIVLGGISKDQMLNAIEISKGLFDSDIKLPFEYEVTNTSDRVIKAIQSYSAIVDKVIWNKK